MTQAELWSVIGSIVSVVLGVFAILLSVYFYVAGRRTESAVTQALTKIETQTDMLQKLSGRQLDRLTRYVTSERPSASPEVAQLLISFTELAKPLAASLHQRDNEPALEEARNELVTCYIAIYYYTALTNYWAQHYLPDVDEFDEKNAFHQLTRRVVDSSATDFDFLAKTLGACDKHRIEASALVHLLKEAQSDWRNSVRTVADVYIARAKDDE